MPLGLYLQQGREGWGTFTTGDGTVPNEHCHPGTQSNRPLGRVLPGMRGHANTK